MTCSHSHGPRITKSGDSDNDVAWNVLFRGEIEFAVKAERRQNDRRTVNGCKGGVRDVKAKSGRDGVVSLGT